MTQTAHNAQTSTAIPAASASVWQSLGGTVFDPAVISTTNDRLYVIARGDDGTLMRIKQDGAKNEWTGWLPLGNDTQPVKSVKINGAPAIVLDDKRRRNVFAAGLDGDLLWLTDKANDGEWNSWKTIAEGGVPITSPVVGKNLDGRLEVFAVSKNGDLRHVFQQKNNLGWSGWTTHGNNLAAGSLAIQANQDGRLEVFAYGAQDGALQHIWQTVPGDSWSNWELFGGKSEGKPAAGRNADGRIEVFTKGFPGLWHLWETAPNAGWTNFAYMNALVAQPAAVNNADGRLELFGVSGTRSLWHIAQDKPSGDWIGWDDLGGPGIVGGPVLGRQKDKRLDVFVTRTDKQLWHMTQKTAGSWT